MSNGCSFIELRSVMQNVSYVYMFLHRFFQGGMRPLVKCLRDQGAIMGEHFEWEGVQSPFQNLLIFEMLTKAKWWHIYNFSLYYLKWQFSLPSLFFFFFWQSKCLLFLWKKFAYFSISTKMRNLIYSTLHYIKVFNINSLRGQNHFFFKTQLRDSTWCCWATRSTYLWYHMKAEQRTPIVITLTTSRLIITYNIFNYTSNLIH